MVNADVSGVCFTQHPDGQGGMLIEAVKGLGEQLVSGQATAQSYRVDPVTQDADCKGFLSPQMIRQIAEGSLKAADAMGLELDMEWAIEDGQLYWLQARPITVNEKIDAFELDNTGVKEDDVLTTCNVGEMLPGAVTPLTIYTSVSGIDFGMRRMIEYVGGIKHMDDLPRGSCVTNFGNHLFINIGSLYKIADYVSGASREGVELSLCGRVLEDLPKPPVPKVSALKKINNARKYFTTILGANGACRKLDKMAKNLVIPVMHSPAGQLEAIDKQLYLIDEAFWLHYITSGLSGAMSSALFLIFTGTGMSEEDAKARMASLLEDIDNIESVDILRSLRIVARALMAEKSDIGELTAQELAAYVKTCGDESHAALDAFLKRHGHRAIREAEMRNRSWRDDEESLMNYLKSVIMSGAEEKNKVKSVDAKIAAILDEQKGLLRWILKGIIGQSRKGVVCREYTKSRCIMLLDKFKAAYRHLAALMVSDALLPDEDLIFFLKPDEIRALVQGEEPGLIKRAIARRRLLEEQKTFKFSDVCVGRPKPLQPVVRDTDDVTLLNGVSLSHGKATGKARVVRSVTDANELKQGEIMVAAFTDIGWSPYYCMLGGLVTEVGSALSHGAVVAREYALPLVSNVPYATEVIKTGDILSIDGTAGKVAIIG
jgi:pyruvate,water dikinase